MRTVTKRPSPYLMKSEKGIIARGPIPYDGREGMFLRLSKRIKSLANSEDESEDDLRLLGISHLKGIPSSLKIRRSELHLKGEFRKPGGYSSWRGRGLGNEGIHSILFNNFFSL